MLPSSSSSVGVFPSLTSADLGSDGPPVSGSGGHRRLGNSAGPTPGKIREAVHTQSGGAIIVLDDSSQPAPADRPFHVAGKVIGEYHGGDRDTDAGKNVEGGGGIHIHGSAEDPPSAANIHVEAEKGGGSLGNVSEFEGLFQRAFVNYCREVVHVRRARPSALRGGELGG